MSTRSNIGKIQPNGKIIAVYCHSDGYLDGVGKILIKNYTDPKKVDELIKLGKAGISYLGSEIGEKHEWNNPPDESWTGFYGRDRGESGGNYDYFDNLEDVSRSAQQDFTYIFNPETKTWQAFKENKPVTIPGQKPFSSNKYDAFFEESVKIKNIIDKIIVQEIKKIKK